MFKRKHLIQPTPSFKSRMLGISIKSLRIQERILNGIFIIISFLTLIIVLASGGTINYTIYNCPGEGEKLVTVPFRFPYDFKSTKLQLNSLCHNITEKCITLGCKKSNDLTLISAYVYLLTSIISLSCTIASFVVYNVRYEEYKTKPLNHLVDLIIYSIILILWSISSCLYFVSVFNISERQYHTELAACADSRNCETSSINIKPLILTLIFGFLNLFLCVLNAGVAFINLTDVLYRSKTRKYKKNIEAVDGKFIKDETNIEDANKDSNIQLDKITAVNQVK